MRPRNHWKQGLAGIFVFIIAIGLAQEPEANKQPTAIKGFELTKVVLCQNVEQNFARQEITNLENVSVRPVCFWAEVKGTEEVLEKLKKEGKIPLQHRWTWDDQSGLKTASKAGEPINVTIAPGTLQKLKWEMESSEDGRFNWRTWSRKSNFRLGTYTVELEFADGSPVLMADGKQGKITFTITK